MDNYPVRVGKVPFGTPPSLKFTDKIWPLNLINGKLYPTSGKGHNGRAHSSLRH